ncbi:hypothetical protein PFICI_14808 [Pestalotiopsis fici W106-1]|uniref:Rhodopsin domain-containing protein n=1 Tax=Pestalotiopsis fici (strain W106-1 / CGMCC3.15140) TaxID=1229662 RepID=W3WL33_PESFW|nr:uncharacterized protein PFICI_14808 [Pestalotiopsis fici W106-1]ETS73862.1 hypothetical protein PFICI_14808 [Pestalotiopsis fici W106-1]
MSWVCLLVQVILMQLSINLGFGRHILDMDYKNLNSITYLGASALTASIVAINASKISFAVTLIPLTSGFYRGFIWFSITTLILFAIPVTVLPWVQCRPLAKTFVDFYPGTCIDKTISLKYGIFQAAWAAFMDFSLALLPWKILWGVQMRTVEKLGVCCAMSLGFLAGATAIARSIYIIQLTTQDISYNAVQSVIWSATESAVTIIAASIPILRKFLKEKISSFGSYVGGYGSSGKSRRTAQSAGNSEARRGSVPLSRISIKPDMPKMDTQRRMSQEGTDDESSRSILHDGSLPGQAYTTREFPEDKAFA